MTGLGARVVSALAAVVIAFGSLVGPAPAVAAGPSPSAVAPATPAATPIPAPTPAPSADPVASPAATPTATLDASASPSPAPSATPVPTPSPSPAVDASSGLRAGATEIPSARTEYSQTYDNHDGTRTTQFFAAPVFYRPDGASAYQPIAVGFAAAPGTTGFVSDQAPVAVAVNASSATGDFLSTTYGERTIGFRMPDAAARAAGSVTPVVDGAVADYADLVPGVDLRVIANAHGAKSFFAWRTAPADPSISYVVDAPGLLLVPQEDGSIAIEDAAGTAVARIPTPYAVDSTPDDRAGGGRFTDAVRLALGADGRTVTVSVDPAWLKTAVYPVYVDPSTGWVYNPGTTTYGDAHIASGYPTHTYPDYQRPDSPYYHELWNGTDPSGTSGTSYDYLKWSLSAYANSTVDSASLRLYPYHQYYNSPTTETTYVRRVTELWYESDVTWDTRPTYTSTGSDSAGCVEGDLCVWDVKAIVQEWLKGASPASNYGFQVDTIGKNSTYWKRFIASEQGGSNRPALTITYHSPTIASTTPAWTPAISWAMSDSGGVAQAKYHVDVAATQAGLGSANLATSGDATGAAMAWAVVPTTPGTMTDGSAYWYQVRAYNGTSWTTWVQGQFTYDAYARGAEAFYTAVPFDLGGGWGLDVAVHNGEARLSRSLYSLPAYGPTQGLELTYDSLNTGVAGMLGYGWSSNLTQSIWLNNPGSPTLVIWNRPDAARVAFTGSGTTWTTVPGHFETLTTDGTEYTVTEPDQTRLVFTGSTGRLARIVDRFGKTLTFAWGGTSATVTHSGTGQVTTLHYPGGSLITSVDDPAGRTWTLGYTGSDLTSLTEPDPDAGGPLAAPSASFNYAGHLLAQVARGRRSAAGATDALVWDIAYTGGKVTGITDAIADANYASVANTFSYTAGSTIVDLRRDYTGSCTPPTVSCNRSVYAFDVFGRVTQEADPNGFLTKRGWNAGTSTLAWLDAPLDASTWTRTAYAYTSSGNLETETSDALVDPVVTRYTYSTSNDVLTTEAADGTPDESVTSQEYDAAGHLVKVTANATDPVLANRLVTEYAYNAQDLVAAEYVRPASEALGVTTTHAYTDTGLETEVVENCTNSGTTRLADPAWKTTCVASGTHDADTNVTTVSTFTAGSIEAAIGLPATTTDPAGVQTTYTYDRLGRGLTEADPSGTTTHEWDQIGNEIKSTVPASPAERVTTQTFDLLNRVTVVDERPLGASLPQLTRTMTYDAAGGRLLETVTPGSGGQGDTTERAYDGAGQEIASRRPAPGSSPTDPKTITRTWYDASGRVTKVVENCTTTGTTVPDAGWETCTGAGTQNASWNLVTTTKYDNRGNVVEEVAPTLRKTTSVYDDLDRLVTRIDNDVASPTLPTQDVTTEYAYDDYGNQTAVKSPTAAGGTSGYRATRSFFDTLGRLTRVIENCTDSGILPPTSPAWKTCAGNGTKDAATNIETTFAYDELGHRLAVTAPSPAATTGTDPALVTTRYAYDSGGRLCRVLENAQEDPQALPVPCTSPTSQAGSATSNVSTRYTYDARGNLASMIDALGNTTTYGWDDQGRMTSLNQPGVATDLTWAFDDTARTKTQTNRSPGSVTWTSDALGRVVTRAYQDASGAARSTTYAYDLAGNLASVIDGTSTIVITSDRLGRPLTVTVAGDTAATTSFGYSFTTPTRTDASGAYTMTVDNAGRTTAIDDPLHTPNWTFGYGANGEPTTTAWPTTTALTTTSGYDALGRLLTKVTGTRAAYTETYNRAGNRLTEASTITGDPGNGTATTAYDPLDRLVAYGLPGIRTLGAGFDAVPNRTTLTTDGTPVTTTFDAANRPTSGGYGYDADGRMTTRAGASGTTLSYDSLGRLVEVRQDPGNTLVARYSYDALDRLLVVERPGQTRIRFRYAGTTTAVAQVLDDATGTVIRNVTTGPEGTVLQDWLGTSQRLYGANGHHDTTFTTDGAGTVTATLRYDPWGNVLRSSGSSLPDWRFQGSWADSATNLAWSVARWYDPVQGTFITEDTLLGSPESPASRHLPAYGQGDPVGSWDPGGNNPACGVVWLPAPVDGFLPSVVAFIACEGGTAIAGFGFGVAATFAGGWAASNLTPARVPWLTSAQWQQVLLNRWWHNVWRDRIARSMRRPGWVIRTEVTFPTWFGDRVEDVCAYRAHEAANAWTPGPIGCLEVKTGKSKYLRDQAAKDAFLASPARWTLARRGGRPFPTVVWFGPGVMD